MKVHVKDLKMRVDAGLFRLSTTQYGHRYYIAVQIKPRKWLPYGTDEEGILKFETTEEAQAKIAELKEANT